MPELKNEILHDAHSSRYSIHPGSTKMYQDLKQSFWWPNMKREIVEWVSKWIVTAIGDPRMEMGTYCYEFCGRVTPNKG